MTNKLIPLQFEATPGNYQKFSARKKSALFQKVRTDIIKHCHNTCCYCGIVLDDEHLEVVNRNNNYSENHKKNLVSACSLCTQVLLFDQYPTDYNGSDRMIYLPTITQAQLSHLYRAIWYHIKNKTKDAAFKSKELLAELTDAAATLDKVAGTELSHPGIFVHYLYGRRSDRQLLKKIRWLPGIDRIEALIDLPNDQLTTETPAITHQDTEENKDK